MPQSHRKKASQRQWFSMDLHLHTPASSDYKQPNVSYLDLLRKAEERNLNVVAFTDHNSASGYARMLEEIDSLELLERLKRLRDDEKKQLDEYRRLREKLLVLPGFEFTATLGFHILGIFPPETPVRKLEYLLMSLRVPSDKIDQGSGEVGATTDALTAYRMINEAGGMAIAAHANSSHGVAMPGFDFGGQTRIAYTQDSNLLALEVTDLDSKSRRRTAVFFSGTKPEYPRRMHCIQGSDSHKLDYDPKYKNESGVGDRATEILLDELSFDAIKAVFLGNDFSRTRPFRPATEEQFDPLRESRELGDTLIQSFHEHLMERRSVARSILEDVVALANTNGGTVYIGASADTHKSVVGVDRPEAAISDLRAAIAKDITPPLEVQIEVLKSQNKNVLQVIVPRGSEVPYALDESRIYVRSENETGLAVRDEIIQLVRDALMVELAATMPSKTVPTEAHVPVTTPVQEEKPATVAPAYSAPRTGVEIVTAEQRKGVWYYSVRDLRNERIVHNVTLKSARRLWQYAIAEHEKNPVDPKALTWQNDIAIVKTYRRGGKLRYDLAQRMGEKLFLYYGVTEDGIHGPWRQLVEGEEITEAEAESHSEVGTPIEIAAEYEHAEMASEAVEEPTEIDTLHPLIIEEEPGTPMSAIPQVEEKPLVAEEATSMEETPIREPELQAPERMAEWVEQVPAEAEELAPTVEEPVSESVSPRPESVEEQLPSVQVQESVSEESVPDNQAQESVPEEPTLALEEPRPSAVVPAPESQLVPKSRAQTWREQLNRAMEEARRARENKSGD
ncbi:MAG: putative DNA binding domain-containing protein [Chloroflexi bacterium]|nr:putative DNA binding domain-containing protein [Chloroflexota bacterium]